VIQYCREKLSHKQLCEGPEELTACIIVMQCHNNAALHTFVQFIEGYSKLATKIVWLFSIQIKHIIQTLIWQNIHCRPNLPDITWEPSFTWMVVPHSKYQLNHIILLNHKWSLNLNPLPSPPPLPHPHSEKFQNKGNWCKETAWSQLEQIYFMTEFKTQTGKTDIQVCGAISLLTMCVKFCRNVGKLLFSRCQESLDCIQNLRLKWWKINSQ